MKAVRYHAYGGPEQLQVDEVEPPTPGGDEVLVAVRAASVNPVDAVWREGHLAPDEDEESAFGEGLLPAVTGTDLAGEVAAVGDDVSAFAPGDRVFGTGLADDPRATFAELAVAPADHLAHLPDAVSFEAAAAGAHVGGTAWRALIEYGEVAPADTVLVHGGSGGVGHMAVQLAAAAGAQVLATAGSDRARETVRDLGADAVLDYGCKDLAAAVREAAGGGVDVILDPHTGEYLPLDVEVASVGARITHLNGDFPAMSHAFATRTKELAIQGVAMHNTPDVGAVMAKLATLLAGDDLQPVVARTFDLEDAAAAQRFLDEEHVVGKVVVTV